MRWRSTSCSPITTFVLWLVIILRALLDFPSPPEPGDHSRFHKRWGTMAAIDMVMTTLDRLDFLLAGVRRMRLAVQSGSH